MLPRDLPPGSYSLSLNVLERDLMARVSLRDVLWEEDRWSGEVVGTVEVLQASDY
jgi:hypothetical protein